MIRSGVGEGDKQRPEYSASHQKCQSFLMEFLSNLKEKRAFLVAMR
jgi:hypothetical protein